MIHTKARKLFNVGYKNLTVQLNEKVVLANPTFLLGPKGALVKRVQN